MANAAARTAAERSRNSKAWTATNCPRPLINRQLRRRDRFACSCLEIYDFIKTKKRNESRFGVFLPRRRCPHSEHVQRISGAATTFSIKNDASDIEYVRARCENECGNRIKRIKRMYSTRQNEPSHPAHRHFPTFCPRSYVAL